MTATHLTLLDLAVVLAVVVTVLGGVRRGRGLFAALASGCLVAIACWLAAAAVLAVGPASWQHTVADSTLVRTAHPPVRAVDQVVDLVTPGRDAGPESGPRR